MIGKVTIKVAFPLSLLIFFSWAWLSFQAYAALENWIVKPVLITPLLGSFLTLLFIEDVDSLRKALGFNE